jgi:hypothetical protein
VFEQMNGSALRARALTWFAPGKGLARVTVISAFGDSIQALAAFHHSFTGLVERHGPAVRESYGLRKGRLVAYADWWDEAGNALHLTWRPDVASGDSVSYLVIVDHIGPSWWLIAPERVPAQMF